MRCARLTKFDLAKLHALVGRLADGPRRLKACDLGIIEVVLNLDMRRSGFILAARAAEGRNQARYDDRDWEHAAVRHHDVELREQAEIVIARIVINVLPGSAYHLNPFGVKAAESTYPSGLAMARSAGKMPLVTEVPMGPETVPRTGSFPIQDAANLVYV